MCHAVCMEASSIQCCQQERAHREQIKNCKLLRAVIDFAPFGRSSSPFVSSRDCRIRVSFAPYLSSASQQQLLRCALCFALEMYVHVITRREQPYYLCLRCLYIFAAKTVALTMCQHHTTLLVALILDNRFTHRSCKF